MKDEHRFTSRCLQLMLTPIARLCIRHSLTIRELVEEAKVALLAAASRDMQRTGQKVNVSRLSVLTGIHRRDVMRLTKEQDTEADEQNLNLVSRIIGQWEQDKRFQSTAGKPRTLTTEEFRELVYLISQDLNAGTVLFQLQRLGVVQQSKAGLRLVKKALSVQDDAREGFLLMAQEIEDLGAAIEENIDAAQEIGNLHARTEFDNIYRKSLPEIKEWLLQEGMRFHERLRTFLSKHDQDLVPSRDGEAGARVVLSTYSRTMEGDT